MSGRNVMEVLGSFWMKRDGAGVLPNYWKASLTIVLQFNYFYINKYFFHQIKGTTMETEQFLQLLVVI